MEKPATAPASMSKSAGFFCEAIERAATSCGRARSASARCFLPKTDLGAQERCRQIVESEILAFGYQIYGWRQCRSTSPASAKKPTHAPRDRTDHDLECERHGKGRLRARPLRDPPPHREQSILDQLPVLYFCSLSCRSIIYKGMFLAESLTTSIRTCWTSDSSVASRSITSATRPTRSRPGSWRSRSACSHTTARSTPSPATSTG